MILFPPELIDVDREKICLDKNQSCPGIDGRDELNCTTEADTSFTKKLYYCNINLSF